MAHYYYPPPHLPGRRGHHWQVLLAHSSPEYQLTLV